jgi:hypothetical protein
MASHFIVPVSASLLLSLVLANTVQVDPHKAAGYFQEAETLCRRDAGRLWGTSLCGPMAIVDAATKTIATSEPAPADRWPAAFGYGNAAMAWGGQRWSTFVWALIPPDEALRKRLWMHELFHRVQPQLGLMTRDGQNPHLDTIEGRYWLRLEWRALAAALESQDRGRDAIRDALTFREHRRRLFPDAAENERLEEIREGLAQYTGTVLANDSATAAVSDAGRQLRDAENGQSFVRSFAYPSGAAYGILLDRYAPGWPRQAVAGVDLGQLLARAAGVQPSGNAAASAQPYGAAALRQAEEERDRQQAARVADLRRRFVDGPVLIIPGAPGSSLNAGVTPVPGAGTVYPSVRVTAEWGTLEAAFALRSTDRSTIVVPAGSMTTRFDGGAPSATDGSTFKGDGWTLTLATGWIVRPSARPGDYEVGRKTP